MRGQRIFRVVALAACLACAQEAVHATDELRLPPCEAEPGPQAPASPATSSPVSLASFHDDDGDPAASYAVPLKFTDDDHLHVIGFDLVLATPFYDDDFGIRRASASGSFVLTPYGSSMQPSPRIWMRRRYENGSGWAAEYWHFDQSTKEISDVVPQGGSVSGALRLSSMTAGDVLTASRGLTLNALDLDMLQAIRWGHVEFTPKAGMAIVHTESTIDNSLTGSAPDSRRLEDVFVGVGPTIGFELRQWTDSDRRVAIVAAARGRLLFGRNDHSVTSESDGDLLDMNGNEVVTTAGIRVGTEWWFGAGARWRPNCMLRFLYEAQYWDGIDADVDNRAGLGFHGATLSVGTWW